MEGDGGEKRAKLEARQKKKVVLRLNLCGTITKFAAGLFKMCNTVMPAGTSNDSWDSKEEKTRLARRQDICRVLFGASSVHNSCIASSRYYDII